jgi:hypothetical protein
MAKKEFTWTQLVIENAVLSYPCLFTPDNFGEQENYKTDCLVPKNGPQFKKVMGVILTALKEDLGVKWEDLKHKPVKEFDASSLERPDLEGYVLIRAKSKADKKKPVVVDTKLNPILDTSEIYGGCIANVNVSIGCYDNKFGKGITIILNAVQKVKDGDPLGGGAGSPSDMFEVINEPTATVGGTDEEFVL